MIFQVNKRDCEIVQELMSKIDHSLSYVQHIKLLPLTIKNYLFRASWLMYMKEQNKPVFCKYNGKEIQFQFLNCENLESKREMKLSEMKQIIQL